MNTFLISLLISILFSLFCGDFIKKNNKKLYIISVILAIITGYLGYNAKELGITKGSPLSNLLVYFTKGFIPTAIFIIVMFTGALNNKLKITQKLLRIRGELSIIASILMFSHGGLYLLRFFKNSLPRMLSGEEMPLKIYVINFSGIIALLIMIPLFITSFIMIRKKMKANTWKKLQKYSYIFYFLTYIHIVFCTSKKFGIDYPKLSLYTFIFLMYTIMRIYKYRNRQIKKLSTSIA